MRLFLLRLVSLIAVAAVMSVLVGVEGHRPTAGISSALAQNAASRQKTIDKGYVVVLRGLMNIWSRGMDTVAKELEARGARVHLDNHRHWKKLAEDIAEKYKTDKSIAPIVIVGHSLGANAAVLMATKLGQFKVPVRLMVTFDGLSHTEETTAPVSYNVKEALNFYNSKILGVELVPGRGFKGKLENVDVQGIKGAGHIKLDKNPELQEQTISLVMKVLKG